MIRCMFDNHVNAFVSQFDKLGPLPAALMLRPFGHISGVTNPLVHTGGGGGGA